MKPFLYVSIMRVIGFFLVLALGVNCKKDNISAIPSLSPSPKSILTPDGENLIAKAVPPQTDWPPPPSFDPLVGNEALWEVFGKFSYVANPLRHNEEHITVTDNWVEENIVSVNIPQLASVKDGSTIVAFHKKAKDQLQKLWNDWESAGLIHLVKTWNGSYDPRFRRGSSTILSNHAFGSAFDINAKWNELGEIPALVGEKGCVRELVQIANDNGFYWGGHFPIDFLDGMHFEVAVLK